jgi:hypothetical protein
LIVGSLAHFPIEMNRSGFSNRRRLASPVTDIWQYPGGKRRNIFAPELCTKGALQYQWPNFGAKIKQTV